MAGVDISPGQSAGGYGDAVGVIVGVSNRVGVIHRGHSAAGGQGGGLAVTVPLSRVTVRAAPV